MICIAAIVAFVVTDSGIALFACAALFALPAVTVVLLLSVKRKVRFACEVRESCIRGGALQLTLRVGALRFAVGYAEVTAILENTTFRKTDRRRFLFKDLSFAPHTYDYDSPDSGRISVRFDDIRLVDVFGICSVKVKCAAFAEAVVSPVLYDDVRIGFGEHGGDTRYGDTAYAKKGNDVSEIYDVRDYAAGDSLGAVHWKLSGKFGSLKSKEFGSTEDRKILILVDLSREKNGAVATDAQLNAVLDVAVSVSDSLKSSGHAHTVGWFDNGELSRAEVSDAHSFVQAVYKLMSIKVDERDGESLFYLSRSTESAAFTKIIYVAAFADTSELNGATLADVTAIAVSDRSGEIYDRGIKMINVPVDGVRDALSDCVL